MYKLGLVSISFRENSPEEILNEMKSAGLSCVEWGSDVHAPCDDTKNLKRLAALQKRYGIECCSYGTYFKIGTTPVKELEGYISAAKVLGTDILRLWCGNKNSEDYTESEKLSLFEACRQAGKIAKDNGVKVCMECHHHTFTNTKESALELMHAVNLESFRMYWQPSQFCTEAENMEYAAQLAGFTEHIHVFNWKEKDRYPLSEGYDTWKNYLSRFSGDRALLLEFMPDNSIGSLKKEAAALFDIAGMKK